MQLDFIAVDARLYVLATILNTSGRFRVRAGSLERGGLNIPFVNLLEARQPYRLLRRAVPLLRDAANQLDPAHICQMAFVFVAPKQLDYSCFPRDGSSPATGGRLIKLPRLK